MGLALADQMATISATLELRRHWRGCPASFTFGQPTRTVADICDPAYAPDATLVRIPEQKFCPDTEGVIASINVTDT
jgi:hypothetical protein